MTDKPDPCPIKALSKLARTPAMRQTLKAVEGLRPIVNIAAPVMKDTVRAKRLNELAHSFWGKNISIGDAFREMQAEIDKGEPLTGRQVLFLTLEARGLDSLDEVVKKNAAKGKLFTHNGRRLGAISKSTEHIFDLAKDNLNLSAKELFLLADKSIIGEMKFDAFRSHVTSARKKYPKEKISK